MIPVVDARVLHRPSAAHGYLPEGPKALGPSRLLWLTLQCGADARYGALHVFTSGRGENRTWKLPGRPGCAWPTDRDGIFLVAMERSVGLFDTGRARFVELVGGLDEGVEGTLVNDGALLPQGLVFGAKDTAFREPKAGLWFLRKADQRLFALRHDMLCSNGVIGRSRADGAIDLFHIDSPTRVVRRFVLDPANGTLGEPTIAVDLRHLTAVPDGMIAWPGSDDVVVAMFEPGPATAGRALRCSLRTGEVLQEFRTPGAAQVTCPAWLTTQHGSHLVLTTASENLDATRLREQPNAGCLFVVPTPGVNVPTTPVWTL